MTAEHVPTPADVAQRAASRFFDPERPLHGRPESLAQRRHHTRDVLIEEVEQVRHWLYATRRNDDDLDLTLELLDRALERFALAARAFDDALNAGPIPTPRTERRPRLDPR